MSEGNESLPVNLALEYRVKLGKSFTFPEKNAFHTLKCEYQVGVCGKVATIHGKTTKYLVIFCCMAPPLPDISPT